MVGENGDRVTFRDLYDAVGKVENKLDAQRLEQKEDMQRLEERLVAAIDRAVTEFRGTLTTYETKLQELDKRGTVALASHIGEQKLTQERQKGRKEAFKDIVDAANTYKGLIAIGLTFIGTVVAFLLRLDII